MNPDTTALLNSTMMTSLARSITPLERAMGRFMRAPDHGDGGDGGAAEGGDAGGGGAAEGAAGGEDGGAAAEEPKGDGLDDAGLLDDADKPKGEEKPEGEAKPEGEGGDGQESEALVGEVPETYALKAPEGRTLDPEATKLFEPIFKELTLTDAGAQKLVDAAPAFIDHVAAGVRADITASVVETRKAWADAAMADPEIGGAKFDESKALAGKVFDRFGLAPDGEFRKLLQESGLGNHPDMIRVMVKMGRAIGEDGFERGDSSKGDVPVWDRVYGQPQAAAQ